MEILLFVFLPVVVCREKNWTTKVLLGTARPAWETQRSVCVCESVCVWHISFHKSIVHLFSIFLSDSARISNI